VIATDKSEHEWRSPEIDPIATAKAGARRQKIMAGRALVTAGSQAKDNLAAAFG